MLDDDLNFDHGEEMPMDLEAAGGDNDDDDNESYATASAASQQYSVTDMGIDDVASENHPIIDDCMRTSAWPLSYGHSINVLSSSPSMSIGNWGTVSASKPPQVVFESSMSRPLIGGDTSASSVKLSMFSSPQFSSAELPTPNRQCSTMQAGFNGINMLCGIGLLTISYAIMQGGWLSLLQLVFFGVLAFYTGILLMRCLESNPGSLRTYPDIGQAAFGFRGRIQISIILYLELFGACVEFLILIAGNLALLFPNACMTFAGIHLGSHQLFTIGAALLVLPTVWHQNLTLLSYFSVGGVVASVLVALCLLWIGVFDEVGFHAAGTPLNLSNLCATIGIYAYAFAGHSVFPNIYTSMKEPSRFPYVLVMSFVSCLLISIGVGACGCLIFGDSIESQLTLSMPKKFVASKVAVWTMVAIPLTKYALTITPVALSLEELLPSDLRGSYTVPVFIRSSLVLSTLVVALTVPFFASVMALLGSLCAMLVSFIFPCACYLSLFRGRLRKLEITSCVFVIVVGVICSVLGTCSAIAGLIAQNRA
ncbi:amino acid transporter AVT1E [Morus notabilis]|uniref:amino acid transporter AVT1E n=1 Tax=Morus notabilis TaxID=981085 RepID=UPI000CED6ED8|nr:amino acid transporter AVT1E [Morus notabilis]